MTKNVAVFNDISGYGKCSLTAAIPVISVLGATPHPIVTEVLTAQSCYPVLASQDLTEMLPQYIQAWKACNAEFDAIYSGYLTGDKQLDYVHQFLDEFKKEDTYILIDPVMGDNGNVYRMYSDELLKKMKGLTCRASLITPNITEACLLADVKYSEVADLVDATEILEKVEEIGHILRDRAYGSQEVIITGVKTREKGSFFIYNVAITERGCEKCRSHFFERSFSGTGDLFASSMLGLKLAGHSTAKSMKIATKFLYHSIADTMNSDTPAKEGVEFERHLGYLISEGLVDEERDG